MKICTILVPVGLSLRLAAVVTNIATAGYGDGVAREGYRGIPFESSKQVQFAQP